METTKLNPQYLVDSAGKQAFVVLNIEQYNELLEDLHDLAIMAKRANEPTISLYEFEKGLKADGLL